MAGHTKQKDSFLNMFSGKDRNQESNNNGDSNQVVVDQKQGNEDFNQSVNYDGSRLPSSTATPFQGVPGNSFEESSESDLEEGQLNIDVYQTEEDIVIMSSISGIKAENLDIQIQNDMVTIRGNRQPPEKIDPEDYYYQECFWGPFSRAVILPVDIDPENVSAELEDGILTVKLPKAEKMKTRKIEVVPR